MNNYSLTRVGIVGFRGYSGAEMLRILTRHPHAEPVLLEHLEKEERARPIGHPAPPRIPCTPEAVRAAGLVAVFLATPADVSMQLAPALLDAGAKVIDLSGGFRLGTAQNFERWYGEPHTRPELLSEAAYGLPEFCRARIAGARLIANPGCYPTAANLALKPLLDAGVVERESGIVCDAKSGVSGAGRKPSLKTSFCEVTENFSTYAILEHRHVPEILRTSGLDEAELSFTAQLIPIDRGILETIYFRAKNVNSADDISSVYRERYAREALVRLYEPGQVPDVHSVAHTNFCDLGIRYHAPTRRAVIVAAIDNLGKGAAGQAVQNMNLALGFEETAGLL
ncbi:MAG TPA: N-acetyl-gamma-glutamyl-phosphate reductase [Bryobacteraceae bacterium]|nr:N-acetyl-gamma-glutamyl-phosphate reductase [Bryobacteraceae bacterium]